MEDNKVVAAEEKLENPLIKYKNLIILFFLFVIATLTVLSNNEIFVVSFQKIKAIKFEYVIIIIGMVLFLWLSDGFLLYYPLRHTKINFWDSLMVNFAGSFFSNVTPYSSGSQPARLYYLYKKGITVDKSIGGVIFKAVSYQWVIVILGLISLFTGRKVIFKMDNYRIVLTLGFIYNAGLFIVTLIIANSKKIADLLIHLVKTIGNKQNKEKELSKTKIQIIQGIENFHNNMHQYLVSAKMNFVMFFTYTIRQLVYNSIPIIILYALDFPVKEYLIELISLSALMNIIVTIVPTPGGVVASEGVFLLLFGLIYTSIDTNDLLAVMLMWRFFTHYLLIIVGFLAVIYLTTTNSKKKKRGMINAS